MAEWQSKIGTLLYKHKKFEWRVGPQKVIGVPRVKKVGQSVTQSTHLARVFRIEGELIHVYSETVGNLVLFLSQ